ncbi:MAG TPA: Holliday junction branch migration protein RuvA [Candidatus Polarisedimenticolia bacterium]|nr:Holliday junction branch migration protein RuvA [Candidatus Polarisedimenticolia bacterium]
MIARLAGTLLEKHPGLLILEVGGVGYELTIPLGTYRAMGEPGSRAELHVHTYVREDTLALYGFATRLEKLLFVRLLGVSGVGPKTAVALLSGLGAELLVEAVRRRDIRRLSGAPGVGRKTAERIALDLADRLDALAESAGTAAPSGVRDDLVSALVNLGYNARAASEAAAGALDGAVPEPPFEDLLRRALRTLSR